MSASRYAEAVTLDQLEIFVEVVDAGSFTAARPSDSAAPSRP